MATKWPTWLWVLQMYLFLYCMRFPVSVSVFATLWQLHVGFNSSNAHDVVKRNPLDLSQTAQASLASTVDFVSHLSQCSFIRKRLLFHIWTWEETWTFPLIYRVVSSTNWNRVDFWLLPLAVGKLSFCDLEEFKRSVKHYSSESCGSMKSSETFSCELHSGNQFPTFSMR